MGFKQSLSDYTNAKILYDEPMRKHTGYGVGGNALYFAEVDSLYSLSGIISLCKAHNVRYKVIGNGTNLLVSDKGYNGMIISTKKISDVFFKVNEVRAMCGASLDKLIKFTADNGLSGIETLVGVPATIGGAIVMNAGTFGRTISDYLTTVETLYDGKIKKYYKDECKFGYRTSRFKGRKEVVISATFKFNDSERAIVNESIKSYKELRKNIQPIGRSCGSVFKNTTQERAGRLIDMAGLKGY